MIWTHESLLEDLSVAICPSSVNVPLGSVWSGCNCRMAAIQNAVREGINDWEHLNDIAAEAAGTPLADLVAIRPSYTRFCLSIYEVKASRSDFLSDIRSQKWEHYLPHCHRFYFAVASGIAKKEEIPPVAGLFVRGKNGWTALKGAAVRDEEIPMPTMMSLLFLKQRETIRKRNLRHFDINPCAHLRRKNKSKEIARVYAAYAAAHKWNNFEPLRALLEEKEAAIREGR